MKLIRKYPYEDLNGKVIAYDIDGSPLGEVVFKRGRVVSRKSMRQKEGRDDEATG